MEDLITRLEALIDEGLVISQALDAFARRQPPGLRAYADRVETREGELEVDDNAIISESSGGAYVMAWAWVDDEDSHESDD
jgi:hypothetical protein